MEGIKLQPKDDEETSGMAQLAGNVLIASAVALEQRTKCHLEIGRSRIVILQGILTIRDRESCAT